MLKFAFILVPIRRKGGIKEIVSKEDPLKILVFSF